MDILKKLTDIFTQKLAEPKKPSIELTSVECELLVCGLNVLTQQPLSVKAYGEINGLRLKIRHYAQTL